MDPDDVIEEEEEEEGEETEDAGYDDFPYGF